MSTRSNPNFGLALLHAAFVGAAIAVFIFVLFWAGEASGFYPPAGRLIDLIANSVAIRTHDVFWRGAASAALCGAAVAAFALFCVDTLGRMSRGRR